MTFIRVTNIAIKVRALDNEIRMDEYLIINIDVIDIHCGPLIRLAWLLLLTLVRILLTGLLPVKTFLLHWDIPEDIFPVIWFHVQWTLCLAITAFVIWVIAFIVSLVALILAVDWFVDALVAFILSWASFADVTFLVRLKVSNYYWFLLFTSNNPSFINLW